MIVAVQEFEVKFDRLFSCEDGYDAFLVQLGSFLWRGIGTCWCHLATLQTGPNNLKELLRGGFSQIERDLIRRQHGFIGRRGSGREVEKRRQQIRGKRCIVEVDEALSDGEKIRRGQRREQLDEKMQDLIQKNAA